MKQFEKQPKKNKTKSENFYDFSASWLNRLYRFKEDMVTKKEDEELYNEFGTDIDDTIKAVDDLLKKLDPDYNVSNPE